MRDLLLQPDWNNETIRSYWDGFQEEEIRVPKCRGCEEFHWYPLAQCPYCSSTDITWEPVNGPLTLFTWVGVNYEFGLPFLEGHLPLYSGLVVPADDERIRLSALVDTAEPPEIGMELAVEFEEDEDGTKYPIYRPA